MGDVDQPKGVSVLDSMAKDIMVRKSERAKGTLTPVAGEQRVAGEVRTTIATPEQVKQLDDIRAALARGLALVTSMKALIDQLANELGQASWYNEMGPGEVAPTPLTANLEDERQQLQKEVEAAADTAAAERTAAIEARLPKREAVTAATEGIEDIANRIARLSKDAQAQVFGKQADTPGADGPGATSELPVADDTGWSCPTHKQAVEKISTRKGRQYRACPVTGCGEFERL